MLPIFEKHFEIGWRDVDPNGHLANMAYLEYAVDTRIAFFASCDFAPESFVGLGFGPVIKTDLVEYFRELVLLETVTVSIENGGQSGDVSRFRVVNSFYKSDRTLAARVTSIGGWLSLKDRKLIAPPEVLKKAWLSLPKTDDFEELPSSLKR
jgi:acyl-CoA thioester hydrolase